MSHSHTHAPGEEHSHSHGPAPPQQPGQQQQQVMLPPTPDPASVALIEADFKPRSIKLGAPDNATCYCAPHGLEKCSDCNVDYVQLNRLSRLLHANPNLNCPPPGNVVSQKLTQVVTSTKDEGNTLFKKGDARAAIGKYSQAAVMACQRPAWEANQFLREELSTVVSNRSAAFLDAGDIVGALIDAETVIQLRRNWSKGHFRKARALVSLGEFDEATEALRLGLSFDATNTELSNFIGEIARVRVQIENMTTDPEKASVATS